MSKSNIFQLSKKDLKTLMFVAIAEAIVLPSLYYISLIILEKINS